MNGDVKEICKQIINEAQAVINYAESMEQVASDITRGAIFEEIIDDELSHLQKLVVALTEIALGAGGFIDNGWPGMAARMGTNYRGSKRIIVVCDDKDNSLQELLEYIKGNSGGGHSFPILVDEGDPQREQMFGFDGDGSDRIYSIEVEKINGGDN
jgi:hypothetical protein